MKKSFLVIVVLTLVIIGSGHLNAQIRKIPSAVTEAFKAKYPDAADVEWKDKLTNFKASFKMNGENYEAKFNNKGEWQQTEKSIEESQLPGAVKDGLGKSKYSEWEISSAAHIEYKDKKEEYRILVKKNDIEKKYLFFNSQGKLLRDTITI